MTCAQIDVDALRELHRARLGAWGMPVRDAHEDDVIERILRYRRGLDTRPDQHPHSHEEMGACLECDAAAVLIAWEDEHGDDSG